MSPPTPSRRSGTERIRVIAGYMEGDGGVTIAGAVNDSFWEVIPEEEWQEMANRWKAEVVGDWQAYDWREVILNVDWQALLDAVKPVQIDAEVEARS